MAGLWYRVGTVTLTNGSKAVVGYGTKWKSANPLPGKGSMLCGPDGKVYEVDTVADDNNLTLVSNYTGTSGAGQGYALVLMALTIPQFSTQLSQFVQKNSLFASQINTLLTAAGDVNLTDPDSGLVIKVPSWSKIASEGEGQAARAKVEADRAKTEADRAAAAANATAEAGTGSLMRVGGATILDAERYALERATGGRQTIIRDSAGNANAMFVLPRFTYADIGMTTDMGAGDITAFDFGSGSIKGEIFIGAYLASGSGAVSAPRQDPRTSLDHTAARNACSTKGAGWHLMTAHEWAAIALWCMANGYEPIGNTNWGRSHAKTLMVGDRADNRAPGDTAGAGRTQTGSMGSEATHTRTLGGIADLVGNVWEWQDGLLLQDGRFKISAYNTQAEVDWAFADAFLDASTPTGGSAILSNAVNNRLGAIGDNANAGNSANVEWRAMTKSGSYVSNQAMKRLLLEPAGALPQGRIYMRNFGERLPFRGGSWYDGANAGLAALILHGSRADAVTSIGFRPAFA
ncbi:hypothetical protein [Aeromonas hydrophila]|uniref:hypothetical protein n=1 Tax=Aeromonas hydrophila TaxID=644 RepID=UPI00292950F0|nr:hypothetical protein [Aeromonas hydrophila]